MSGPGAPKNLVRRVAINNLLDAVRAMRCAEEAGERAYMMEEDGPAPERSSASWFEEANVQRGHIYELLDHIDGVER